MWIYKQTIMLRKKRPVKTKNKKAVSSASEQKKSLKRIRYSRPLLYTGTSRYGEEMKETVVCNSQR